MIKSQRDRIGSRNFRKGAGISCSLWKMRRGNIYDSDEFGSYCQVEEDIYGRSRTLDNWNWEFTHRLLARGSVVRSSKY